MNSISCDNGEILYEKYRGPALTTWLILMLLLGSGCAFVRGSYGEDINQGDVSTIKKGVSTRAEVAAILGAPDRIITEDKGRDIFHYYHYDVKSGYVLIFSRINIKSDDIFVIFNSAGVVEDVIAGKQKPPLAFQFWPFD
jgi:outer membrane protein assembly factor BamE (lipoprotein component of BamABCDE complex)